MREDEDTTAAAIAAANEYLGFLRTARSGADAASLTGAPEARRFFAALVRRPAAFYDAIATTLCSALPTLPDPLAASLVANNVGSLVESGLDAAPLAAALLARLPADLAAARRFVVRLEAEAGVERPADADAATVALVARDEPVGASAWAGLQSVTPAAMAAFSRHRPSRLSAKRVPGFTDDAVFLGERGAYCYFLGELLAAADGVALTVIAPEVRKGFVVELEVVRNAAHLFALLEDTLVGDPTQGLLAGPRTSPHVAAIARGEAELTEGLTFPIGWHYAYWYGFAPAGFARSLGVHPLVAAMIGVEANVLAFPGFRGQRVILMKAAELGARTCDARFFAPLYDALRSRVTIVRHMSESEVDELCGDMKAEAERFGA